jgi:hypothetical protein
VVEKEHQVELVESIVDEECDCLSAPEANHQIGAGALRSLRPVGRYLESDDPDPCGYADDIPVIPHRGDDYVTRTLTADAGLRLPG